MPDCGRVAKGSRLLESSSAGTSEWTWRLGRTLSSAAVWGHRVPKDRQTRLPWLGRFTHQGSDGAHGSVLTDPRARVR